MEQTNPNPNPNSKPLPEQISRHLISVVTPADISVTLQSQIQSQIKSLQIKSLQARQQPKEPT